MNRTTRGIQRGFTIVELLIVIVVIGILAAIVVVAYNGIQNQAYDTTVKSDLATVVKKIELEKVKNEGLYPHPLTVGMELHFSKDAYLTTQNNVYYCRDPAQNRYAFSAKSRSGKQYIVVDGVLSEHGSMLFGQTTCDLIDPNNNPSVTPNVTWDGNPTTGTGTFGYNTTTSEWQPWTHNSN